MPQKTKALPRSSNGVYPAPARKGWIYLFSGEDEFRKRLSLQRLKTKLLGEKKDPFNYELFYGKEARAEEIIRSLGTIPLAADRKLTVLKEPELLPEEDRARLADYLNRSQKGRAVFVVLSQALPLPNDKLSAALSKHAKVINFARLRPEEIYSWIIEEFKARNKIITGPAARLVCETAQQDLGRISSIIEQLSVFTGRRERITDDDLLSFSDTPPESSAFKLLDYIGSGDTRRSLQVLNNLLRWNNNPSRIIGLLGRHLTRLIAIKRMLRARVERGRILSYFNLGSYALNNLISQAEEFTLPQLRNHLNTLLDIDLRLKSSSIKGSFLLEMFIIGAPLKGTPLSTKIVKI